MSSAPMVETLTALSSVYTTVTVVVTPPAAVTAGAEITAVGGVVSPGTAAPLRQANTSSSASAGSSVPGARLVAWLTNATADPSRFTDGNDEPRLAGALASETLSRVMLPSARFLRKMSVTPASPGTRSLAELLKATNCPLPLIDAPEALPEPRWPAALVLATLVCPAVMLRTN